MTQKLATALVAAILLCGGASLALAQDNSTANPAPAGSTADKGETMGKKHKGMDACKDDVAKYCADAKGHKQVHECLEKNEDQLSPACKKHHEKMEKKWSKKHKGAKADKDAAPQPGSSTGGQTPGNPPTNP